jgi:hypothetical protein
MEDGVWRPEGITGHVSWMKGTKHAYLIFVVKSVFFFFFNEALEAQVIYFRMISN